MDRGVTRDDCVVVGIQLIGFSKDQMLHIIPTVVTLSNLGRCLLLPTRPIYIYRKRILDSALSFSKPLDLLVHPDRILVKTLIPLDYATNLQSCVSNMSSKHCLTDQKCP